MCVHPRHRHRGPQGVRDWFDRHRGRSLHGPGGGRGSLRLTGPRAGRGPVSQPAKRSATGRLRPGRSRSAAAASRGGQSREFSGRFRGRIEVPADVLRLLVPGRRHQHQGPATGAGAEWCRRPGTRSPAPCPAPAPGSRFLLCTDLVRQGLCHLRTSYAGGQGLGAEIAWPASLRQAASPGEGRPLSKRDWRVCSNSSARANCTRNRSTCSAAAC